MGHHRPGESWRDAVPELVACFVLPIRLELWLTQTVVGYLESVGADLGASLHWIDGTVDISVLQACLLVTATAAHTIETRKIAAANGGETGAMWYTFCRR
ncbi:MAG TPA: hypothetical protein VD767_11985 [Thermomicrobiales bacterium]|nr:hypothetical protein [Thermomicrobiales bacterium]